jgi:hypothetical protein
LSYNASVVKNHDLTNSIARFYSEIFFLWCKNALAYYNAGGEHSCKFKGRSIGSRSSRVFDARRDAFVSICTISELVCQLPILETILRFLKARVFKLEKNNF